MKSSDSNSIVERIESSKIALPWHQQLVMKVYLGHFVANTSDAAQNRRCYEGFSRKIISLASEIPYSQHTIPVLVPPQPGLLDDTRYWSIAMTIEHLLLVDSMAKEIIIRLARGEAPDLKITLKSVVPTGKIEPQKVLEDYRAFVPSRLDEIDIALATTKSEVTEVHPIFGNFNARQWQWSMAARTALRYRQLKNIRKGLSYDPPAEREFNRPPALQGV